MASLLALSRAEQEVAKKLYRKRLAAHLATLGLGILALILPEPYVFAMPAFALSTEALALYWRYEGDEAHSRSEQGRRAGTLCATLGRDPDPIHSAALNAEMSARARKNAHDWEDPEFFASDSPPGPARLRTALEESSFWSARLYAEAGKNSVIALVVFLTFGATLLLALFSSAHGSGGEFAARTAVVVLGVLIASDELAIAMRYISAGRTAESALLRLRGLDENELGALLAVFGDYVHATTGAAPIPTRLYTRRHDELDAAWRDANSLSDQSNGTGHIAPDEGT